MQMKAMIQLKNGGNLLIKNKTNSDKIIIDNWYSSSDNRIETMSFTGGMSIDIDPTISPIIQIINEDNALIFDILTEYSGQLAVDSLTQGQNGTVSLNAENRLVYASGNGIQLTSVSDVKNNQDLMTMVANSWHS